MFTRNISSAGRMFAYQAKRPSFSMNPLQRKVHNTAKEKMGRLADDIYRLNIGLATSGGALLGGYDAARDEPILLRPPLFIAGAVLGGFLGFAWGVTAPISYPYLAWKVIKDGFDDLI